MGASPPSASPPPASPYVVRRLRADEAREFRWIRLRSLADDPLAFGSTYAREAAFPAELWVERTREGAMGTDRSTWVAADPAGRLVGLVGSIPGPEGPVVVAMRVEPAARRQGIAGRLLDAVLAWADRTDPDRPIRLSVNPAQLSAVRLYESRGFVRTGETEPLAHTPAVRVDVMVRPPRARTGRPTDRRASP